MLLSPSSSAAFAVLAVAMPVDGASFANVQISQFQQTGLDLSFLVSWDSAASPSTDSHLIDIWLETRQPDPSTFVETVLHKVRRLNLHLSFPLWETNLYRRRHICSDAVMLNGHTIVCSRRPGIPRFAPCRTLPLLKRITQRFFLGFLGFFGMRPGNQRNPRNVAFSKNGIKYVLG